MDSAERDRIIAESRRLLSPEARNADREQLVRRTLAEPGEDPVERWRRQGRLIERDRAAAKREMHVDRQQRQQAAQSRSATDWASWVRDQILTERAFLTEVIGSALGEMTANLEKGLLAKVDELDRLLKREREMHQREIRQLQLQVRALEALCGKELAHATSRTTALERRVDQINVLLGVKRVDDKVDETRKDVAQVRQDLANKFKLN